MLLALHRVAGFLQRIGVPVLPRLIAGASRILFGVVLPPSVRIGRQTLIGYQGLGTVIHARTSIGARVNIGPGVTIGGRSGHVSVPVIEDDVVIGAGARVLGPIIVGRGAVIGANAVVIHDVPPGAVVGGVPARVLRHRSVKTTSEGAGERE